jgi:hypothetical protein
MPGLLQMHINRSVFGRTEFYLLMMTILDTNLQNATFKGAD